MEHCRMRAISSLVETYLDQLSVIHLRQVIQYIITKDLEWMKEWERASDKRRLINLFRLAIRNSRDLSVQWLTDGPLITPLVPTS